MSAGFIQSVLTEQEYGCVLESMREHRSQLTRYQQALMGFNRTINLVSRKRDPDFFDHHLFHALALACRRIPSEFRVVDWGAGGGIPSLPLASVFTDVAFHCVDKVDKKMRSVRAMARQLGFSNVTTVSARAEEVRGSFDLSISRATAPLSVLWSWHLACCDLSSGEVSDTPHRQEPTWKKGLICLKGGDLEEEVGEMVWARSIATIEIISLAPLFEGEYFRDKKIVSIVQE